jgi:hypothetical protein
MRSVLVYLPFFRFFLSDFLRPGAPFPLAAVTVMKAAMNGA